MKRRKIDFSEIPELSEEQLARMRRVGRPARGDRPRKLISIRLDQRVLAWVKAVASEKDRPYQALINHILEKEIRDQAFFDLAMERAIRSSLKIVLNSMFLLIQSFLLITESVIAPR